MPWNRGEHRRKFLKVVGGYLDGSELRRGALMVWGEWEPQSRIAATYPKGQPSWPRYLHEPWWETPRDRELLQNTDPIVFGKRFLYSNCRQTRNGALRRLAPGSLVLFGSSLGGSFVLDTVFVVARPGIEYLRGASQHLDVPPWVRSVVFDPLGNNKDRRGEPLRLYEGARYDDDPTAPFSFVPCRPFGQGDPAFPRPRIALNSHWMSPRLAMGAKAIDASHREVRDVWSDVVAQVRSAGLVLGVELEVPPSRQPSNP
jgi:hypothetical protein